MRSRNPGASPAGAAAAAFVSGAAALAAFVLPQRCPGCEHAAPAPVLCARCWSAIPRAGVAVCARCLASEHAPDACARHPDFQVRAAWIYDERAAAVVAAFKYGARPRLALEFAPEMVRALPGCRAEIVTEVPLHPARRRERGFNQAERLAAAVASLLGVPHVPEMLARARAVPAQATLGRSQRRRHASGTIVVRHPERVGGRRILVVDDVITTGATFVACLEPLAAAGARPSGVALAWAP